MTSVAEIWRYPVKSLGGEALQEVNLTENGLDGDRLARVEDDRGTVTALRKQRMVGVPVRLGDDGEPLIDGSGLETPEAAATVQAVSGDGAKIVRTPDDQRSHDLAPILVATDGALEVLGYDRRRFRPNIVLEGVEAVAEREWLGKKLTIGDAVLSVIQPCERCGMTIIDPDTLEIDPDVLRRVKSELGGVMGMYCKVDRPAAIAVGDEVTIE